MTDKYTNFDFNLWIEDRMQPVYVKASLNTFHEVHDLSIITFEDDTVKLLGWIHNCGSHVWDLEGKLENSHWDLLLAKEDLK